MIMIMHGHPNTRAVYGGRQCRELVQKQVGGGVGEGATPVGTTRSSGSSESPRPPKLRACAQCCRISIGNCTERKGSSTVQEVYTTREVSLVECFTGVNQALLLTLLLVH